MVFRARSIKPLEGSRPCLRRTRALWGLNGGRQGCGAWPKLCIRVRSVAEVVHSGPAGDCGNWLLRKSIPRGAPRELEEEKGLRLQKSNFVLHHCSPWPHETTLANSTLLRLSAC